MLLQSKANTIYYPIRFDRVNILVSCIRRNGTHYFPVLSPVRCRAWQLHSTPSRDTKPLNQTAPSNPDQIPWRDENASSSGAATLINALTFSVQIETTRKTFDDLLQSEVLPFHLLLFPTNSQTGYRSQPEPHCRRTIYCRPSTEAFVCVLVCWPCLSIPGEWFVMVACGKGGQDNGKTGRSQSVGKCGKILRRLCGATMSHFLWWIRSVCWRAGWLICSAPMLVHTRQRCPYCAFGWCGSNLANSVDDVSQRDTSLAFNGVVNRACFEQTDSFCSE